MKKIITLTEEMNDKIIELAKRENKFQTTIIIEAITTYLFLQKISQGAKEMAQEFEKSKKDLR